MIVIYARWLGRFAAVLHPTDDTDVCGLACNECVWIVPGTVTA